MRKDDGDPELAAIMQSATRTLGKKLDARAAPEHQTVPGDPSRCLATCTVCAARMVEHRQYRARAAADAEKAAPEAVFKKRLADLERWGVPYQDAMLLCGRHATRALQDTAAMANVDEFLTSADAGRENICVLAGLVGTGKSVAAAYFLEKARPVRHGRTWLPTEHPRFLHTAELLAMGLYEHEDERQRLRGTSALAIDDQGVEYLDGKGVGLAIFDWLINTRYGSAGYTVITTNLTADQFRDRYGVRIYDRLRQQAYWNDIEGASMRRPPAPEPGEK